MVNINTTPLYKNDSSKMRNSNLELYRIIVMFLIVIHHYVVNSGLISILAESPVSASSLSMLILGAWGKTGINCFIMITGYFMCKSDISSKKILRLYIEILFYSVIVYGLFLYLGRESLSLNKILFLIFPVDGLSSNFTSCFMVFYLLIPILNKLLSALDKKMHLYLIAVTVIFFSILPLYFRYKVLFNYVTWFSILYFVASYIRIYGIFHKVSYRQWGIVSMLSIVCGLISIIGMYVIYKAGYLNSFVPYFFISDSNKFGALIIAFCTFMYFKDLKIPYNSIINKIGASTFGILLIHANSDAMRQWLWMDTIKCVEHFTSDVWYTVGYAVNACIIIFAICSVIDIVRAKYIEPIFMRFFMYMGNKISLRLSYKWKWIK